jgi:hypothetical protein
LDDGRVSSAITRSPPDTSREHLVRRELAEHETGYDGVEGRLAESIFDFGDA